MFGLAVNQRRRLLTPLALALAGAAMLLCGPSLAAQSKEPASTAAAPEPTAKKEADDSAAKPDDTSSDDPQTPTVKEDPKDDDSAKANGNSSDDPEETLEQKIARWNKVEWQKLVKEDQLKFLQQLRTKCDETVVDFTATFHKQERIRGKLRDEEAAEIKIRSKPFAVYLKYVKGDSGREALYVDGKYDNKIQAHPGGALGPLFQVKVEPDSETAMKDNLRPITMAGMTNMMHTIVPQFELAQANGDLKTEYLGKMDLGGRKVYAVKRILPKKDIYPCKELVVFVDCEALVPVGADSYGWDGQLESKYRYTDFKINVGLTDDDFDKKNKAYNFD